MLFIFIDMSDCCIRCNTYKKNPALDYCCLTCRDSLGKRHSHDCEQIICGPTKSEETGCCPKCKTYRKYPGFDFCCKTCLSSNGQNHGSGCQRNICPQPQALSSKDICCPICSTYQKYADLEYCCQICKNTYGQDHGSSCLRILCREKTLATETFQEKTGFRTNCYNLRTNKPLYKENKTICFSNSTSPYYEFRNTYHAPIMIDNVTYLSAEQYYQSQKFLPKNKDISDQILRSSTAFEAIDIAKRNSNKVRLDWDTGHRDVVMQKVLDEKFNQNPNLKYLLLGTGNKALIYHTTVDNYWGDHGDGRGDNKLGKYLMDIRNKYNNKRITPNKDYYSLYQKYKNKYLKLKKSFVA